MVVKISLTQEDIDGGCALNDKTCPVAKAIMRTGEFEYVSVVPTDIVFRTLGSDILEITKTPIIVGDFIYNFDRDLPVQPFEFELELI